MTKEPLPKLSASKIKTLKSCSWSFYCQYELKLPKKSNDGASRGTIVHLVYEMFLNPRHAKYFDEILKAKDARVVKSIWRMVLKHAKILKVNDKENLNLINKMILVGMELDFYCNGSVKLEAESEFNIVTDIYHINGFIDKKAVYPDGSIKIWDYKTSKKKFSEAEMDDNMQAMMYSLAQYRLAGVVPEIAFLFLREKEPIQKAYTYDADELEGFEYYLGELTEYIRKFDTTKAMSDYAANDPERSWLCGYTRRRGELKKDGNPKWDCQNKWSLDYYVLLDESGKILKSSDTDNLVAKDKQRVEKRHYAGCPRWNKKKATTETNAEASNDFDF